MRNTLPKSLFELASKLDAPLYAVGGCVRDFLSGAMLLRGSPDFDICAPIAFERFIAVAESLRFTVRAVYKTTGTVKLVDSENNEFEFSSFRSDKYIRGVHAPVETVFTSDITLDARRRDFTVNAVYYDIQKDAFVDPLQGIPAIQEKRMTTVASPLKVFGEDGLRLLRLARQAAQTGFYPDAECLDGAKQNADLISDIVPERIFTELSLLLNADLKYGVMQGPYIGVSLLNETRVLDRILPELTLGRGMSQRADFHNHDVLEHSLRAVRYAEPSVRLAALLHDIGKPVCTLRDGNAFAHPETGAKIAKTVLSRWKAPMKTTERVASLIALHMYDFNSKTKENKLRRFFVQHHELLPDLLLLKQADFSACKDDLSTAPTVARWQALLAQLAEEHAPLTLRELAISGKDLLDLQFPPREISERLNTLLNHAVLYPQDNTKKRLLALAKKLPCTR